jgi:hypothetical protein
VLFKIEKQIALLITVSMLRIACFGWFVAIALLHISDFKLLVTNRNSRIVHGKMPVEDRCFRIAD